jgi:hypothetical protein
MQGGKLWRPWQLRSGIAAGEEQKSRGADEQMRISSPALTHPGER